MTDIESLVADRADWLLDAVAAATQNRMFLRGDPAYDEAAGEAILLNGEKAMRAAIRTLQTEKVELREAFALADKLVCDAIKWSGYYVGEGNLEALAAARQALSNTGEME